MTIAIEDRAAIKPHSTDTSDQAWDGAANEKRLREGEAADYYAGAFAWRDGSTDGTVKADYSFIHHEVDGDGNVGAANLTACSTGIGVVNGGRLAPGTRPKWAGDRQGIWRHLARHLEDADQTPPPLRERSLSGSLERRAFPLDSIELEERAGGGLPMIRGHAAVFDQLSEPIGYQGFRERIRPGAFTKTLQEADVRALFNHDSNLILGRTKSGTLRVSEDKAGLAFEVDVPDTTYARDLLVSIKRGDVDQASFQFAAVQDEFKTEKGETIRDLIEARLFDVSPVVFPAYPQTDVSVRTLLAEAGIAPELLAGLTDEEIESRFQNAFRVDVTGRADAHPRTDADDGPGGRPPTLLRKRLELMERTHRPDM